LIHFYKRKMSCCIEKVLSSESVEDFSGPVKPRDVQDSSGSADLVSQNKFNYKMAACMVVEVNLSRIQLTCIPKQLSECKSLQSLNMSHNNLSSVSFDLSTFPMLSRLDLSHNSLISLPTSLSLVPMLSFLSLSHNQLSSLPVTMASSSTIRQLFLDNNCLISLPSWFSKLCLCSKISLSHNPLGDLLDINNEFGKICRRLKYLDMSNLSMNTMPSTLCELLDLRHLTLSNTKHLPNMNRLSSLPTQLCNLIGLVKLQAVGVNLTELPDSFHLLTNLEILDISSNSIIWLPSSIHLLSKLRFLNISNNNIFSLPLDFEKLASLRHLFASQNRIAELPEKLGENDKLITLDMYDNRLHHVELELLVKRLVRCDFAMNHLNLTDLDDQSLALYQSKEESLRSWEEDLGEGFVGSVWQGKLRSRSMKLEESLTASEIEYHVQEFNYMYWEESDSDSDMEIMPDVNQDCNEADEPSDGYCNEVDEPSDGYCNEVDEPSDYSENWTVEGDIYDLPVKFEFRHNLQKMHLEEFWGKEQFCPSDQHAQTINEKILEIVEEETKRRRRLGWVGRASVLPGSGIFSLVQEQEHQFDDAEEPGANLPQL